MTTRMGDERSRSPLHVHVGQGTPVHVHLKAKASGSMMWQVGKEKKNRYSISIMNYFLIKGSISSFGNQ